MSDQNQIIYHYNFVINLLPVVPCLETPVDINKRDYTTSKCRKDVFLWDSKQTSGEKLLTILMTRLIYTQPC